MELLDILKLILSTLHYPILIIDFIIVYYITYRLLAWINNTQTENVTRGLVLVFLVYTASRLLGLTTLTWLLNKFSTVIVILLIIIFQSELRRFLERIGTGQLFSSFLSSSKGQSTVPIQHLLRSIDLLSSKKIGALIAIEVGTSLNQYIESGVRINAHLTSDLLSSLFWPGSPTHDGASIIQGNTIEAAGCLLPLTETTLPDRRLGTRHRAALALSELSDAIIIVISEETGVISLAENGSLTRYLNKEALEARLFNLYKEEDQEPAPKLSLKQFLLQLVKH